MISSFSILGSRGDILVHRLFQDDVGRREVLQFSNRFVATREVIQAAPVNTIGTCHFLHIVQGEIHDDGITQLWICKYNSILSLT